MTKIKSLQNLLVALFLSFMLGLASNALHAAEARIGSWNVKRMTADRTDIGSAAAVINQFDVMAIQEVMEEQALIDLHRMLESISGEAWGVMTSHAIGRGTYKERYAFVWRKSAITYVDGAIVFLDHRDVFAREPFSARFMENESKDTFILANIHVLYGKSKEDRVPEIQALADYWEWLGSTFPQEQYFLMGDFNMPPNDKSFSQLKTYAMPMVTRGASTLSSKNGKFVNLYDNIWVPQGLRARVSAGIYDYPKALGIKHEQARDNVSDHAPVYMVLSDMDESSGHFIQQSRNAIPPAVVRGNKNSGIYHLPHCDSYELMARSPNLVTFASEQAAQQSGFRIARNCGS